MSVCMGYADTSFAYEIVVISAEDLTLSGHRIKKNAFVSVFADSDATTPPFTTTVDRDGGSFPHWNEKTVLALSPATRYVEVRVRCRTPMGERLVGKAAVPVSDFQGGLLPADYLHFLSYRLRDEKGNPNGIINLSVRRRQPQPCGYGGFPFAGGRPSFAY